jgi:hypothetical protein
VASVSSGKLITIYPPPPPPHRPRRLYPKVTLDPNRPTPQVSNIAQSILSELDRARGTRITMTLDIDAETLDGFPKDVEDIVRDNAANLRITKFDFEGDRAGSRITSGIFFLSGVSGRRLAVIK